MTKADLIEKLGELQKLPHGRAEALVNCILQSMHDALTRGERIELRGFGSFEIRSYKPYQGRNPRTGNAVPVKPKRLPFFKVGKELKERVNASRREQPAAAAPAARRPTPEPAPLADYADPADPLG